MTLPVNLTNVVEVVVVTGSLILGFIVLATYWRERSGKLFGFLCLLLALWKGFEFADPELTTAAWVDSTGWALGALSIALAWHFVVSYTYRGYREPRLLWAAMYPAALLLAIPPFLGSLRLNTVYHACFTVNYMAGMGGIVALTFRAYLREKSREMIWAILGTLSIAIGAGIHIITLLLDLDPFHFHTYGMLGFELFFGYDIMVGGLLRIR
ncbi:MAG: hypothetical protein PHS26_11440, partial [Actinomycetota bacterium]|nr:hypothetical protein [Actinomycetota bacterium]